MKDSDMRYTTATEQLAALKAGQTSSLELVKTTLERIEQLNPSINAVVVKDSEKAEAAAVAADKARQAGDDRPLLGLPLTVKEAFDVEGLCTSWGLPGQHKPAQDDAVVVKRLKSAGAIILGKTNVATMLSDWQTANPVYGVTNNPWDLERTPGGSSGGGCAAVASGMSPLDFGSDLAGSLRIPAAFCGVYAHRPSHGIVPMRGFAPPMVPRGRIAQQIDQSTVGPIARSAADLKLALDVVAGADQPNSSAWKLRLPASRQERLKDFRVLVLDQHPLVQTAECIQERIADLAAHLDRIGSAVGRDRKAAPDLKKLHQAFSDLLMSLMGADMPKKDYLEAAERAKEDKSSSEDQSLVMSHRDWINVDRLRLTLAEEWMATFSDWDVVVCPVAPCTAFRHDSRPFEERKLKVDSTTVEYNMLPSWTTIPTPVGLPATAVPIGLDETNLPIGIQIIGPQFEDYTPIAFAAALDDELGFRFRAPVFDTINSVEA